MGRAFLFALSFLLVPRIGECQACFTTLPPNPSFAPPAPYDSIDIDGAFWYGTAGLWTKIAYDNVWHTKNNVDKTGGYATKLLFWSSEYDWRKEDQPEFVLTARRVDRDAPEIASSGAMPVFVDKPAMMVGIGLPSTGCWQISGHYRGHTVSFTVSVEP
jgi:hypothetical protein